MENLLGELFDLALQKQKPQAIFCLYLHCTNKSGNIMFKYSIPELISYVFYLAKYNFA